MDKQVVRELLGKIYLECQEQSAEINAKRFRAQNRKHIDTLDQMEKCRYLEHMRDRYLVRLGALPFIQDTVPQVTTMINHGNEIYKILEFAYEENQEQEIAIDPISETTGNSIADTITTLLYIRQAHILSGYSNDLAKNDAFIKPSESILKHKSFSEIIEKEHADLIEFNERLENEEEIELEYDEPIQYFQQLIHPRIEEQVLQLYNDGHLRDAVLNSMTAVFDFIRERTGLDYDGELLVNTVFSLNDPYLVFSNLETESGKSDQKGFMQILRGIYQGIRNPKAHTLTHSLTNLEAAQYLVLASLLARRIEEAELVKKE